jgi:NAD(P)-dependent dehydrogenase (short-subunit alcohol dehydrogenase family)
MRVRVSYLSLRIVRVRYHCPIEDMPMHDVRKVFDVNTLGGIALVQRFIPLLRQHKVHHLWSCM